MNAPSSSGARSSPRTSPDGGKECSSNGYSLVSGSEGGMTVVNPVFLHTSESEENLAKLTHQDEMVVIHEDVRDIDKQEMIDGQWHRNAFANLRVLKITAISFFLFVVAEVVGAVLSNSLSLLGDASAMSLDVSTYVISIFVEEFKLRNHGARLSVDTMWLVDIGIPTISVIALLAVTMYISVDAVKVLYNPPRKDEVDVLFLYGFSCANMVVDVISAAAFLNRGDEAFYEEKEALIGNSSATVKPLSDSQLVQRVRQRGESDRVEGNLGCSSQLHSPQQKVSLSPRDVANTDRGSERRISISGDVRGAGSLMKAKTRDRPHRGRKDKNFNMISAWCDVFSIFTIVTLI